MTNTDINPIGALVRKAEQDFIFGHTQKSQYVQESLYEDISKIEAYLASKHTSGPIDSMGRDKPFFNIGIAARNICFRATDLDRKDIVVQDENPIIALIAKIYLQDWMDKNNFGQFLNNWGLNLAAYNETVVKFVEQDGQLFSMVIPWSRLICDTVDFDSNPKIEVLELTPAQLRMRTSYDQEKVSELIENLTSRETQGKNQKDTKNEFVKVYEIHGNLPLSYLTGKESDEKIFAQQMHVITFTPAKKKGDFNDYVLYSGKEKNDPYMLTALMPEIDGSIGLNGTIKNLFEAQWMQNHSIKAIKDQLDLSSKLIFQTSDGNFVGQNALSAIETGDILIHAVNQPLTQLANTSHDITSLQNFQSQWKVLANEINGISEAMLGQNPKSGTAWRQTQAILNESHSLFEVMTENKGLALEQMMRKYVIPFIKKSLNNTEKLVATLDAHDIKKIDSLYLKNKVNSKTNRQIIKKIITSSAVPTEEERAGLVATNTEEVQNELSLQGGIRTFSPSDVSSETWADLFKDLEWNVKLNITGEASNDNDMVSTLTTTLQTIAGNPEALKNPAFSLVFNRILSLTGAINPVEINQAIQEAQTIPSATPNPSGGSVGEMELKAK